MKPPLYVHVRQAKHFLTWEVALFADYFDLVDRPSVETPLLAFGPDVLDEAANLPAHRRFAVLLPGFGYNPLYNLNLRARQWDTIDRSYCAVFVNPGPLELAFHGHPKVLTFAPSVDPGAVSAQVRERRVLNRLLHASSNYPQKDRRRSIRIMKLTGLDNEVIPRQSRLEMTAQRLGVGLLASVGRGSGRPVGYVEHTRLVERYGECDGFVHVARDIQDPVYIDGKYTATLIEAGLTGALLFWHDTLGLGNDFETVFDLPLDPRAASERIMDIRSSVDIRAQSRSTRDELLERTSPARSVMTRCNAILEAIDMPPELG